MVGVVMLAEEGPRTQSGLSSSCPGLGRICCMALGHTELPALGVVTWLRGMVTGVTGHSSVTEITRLCH